jgi:hypothetical protein
LPDRASTAYPVFCRFTLAVLDSHKIATPLERWAPTQEGVTTVERTILRTRPLALTPACVPPAERIAAHAYVVGQAAVWAQVSPQQHTNGKASVSLIGTDFQSKTNSNGTTSAQGAGMAKSLRDSGGIPPRGRPV